MLNNILAGNQRGLLSIPFPGPRAHNNASDGNLYDQDGPLVWSRFAGGND